MSRARWHVGVLALVGLVAGMCVSTARPAAPQDLGCRIQGPQTPITIDYIRDPIYAPFGTDICNAINKGIVNTCGYAPPDANHTTVGGLFCSSQLVTRPDMAFMLENGRRRTSAGWQLAPAAGVFVDVPPDHPLGCWIEQLSADGVTTGCQQTPVRKYCSGQNVTRAEMATFLSRAMDLDQVTDPQYAFADVPSYHWADGYIKAIRKEGITHGCDIANNLFCPETTIPRDQAAVWFARAFAAGCTFTVTAPPATHAKTSGTYSVGLTTEAGCPWRALANNKTTVPWITVLDRSGTGNAAAIRYSLQANTTGSARTATLLVGWKVLTITQSGT